MTTRTTPWCMLLALLVLSGCLSSAPSGTTLRRLSIGVENTGNADSTVHLQLQDPNGRVLLDTTFDDHGPRTVERAVNATAPGEYVASVSVTATQTQGGSSQTYGDSRTHTVGTDDCPTATAIAINFTYEVTQSPGTHTANGPTSSARCVD